MKTLAALIMTLGLCPLMNAADPVPASPVTPAAPVYSAQKEFIFFCFFNDVPSSAKNTITNGIKVGAPFSFGAPVNGLECSVFASASSEVDGVQASILVNDGKKVEGLQFGIINILDMCDGLQLGIFNMARAESFQIGIVNYIEGATVPVLPFVNFKF